MQQAAALVIAYGLDMHIGGGGKPADRERSRTHDLTPYLGTEASMRPCQQIRASRRFPLSSARASPPSALRSAVSCRWRWFCWGSVAPGRSEEHTSELQSLMRISYAVFCLK